MIFILEIKTNLKILIQLDIAIISPLHININNTFFVKKIFSKIIKKSEVAFFFFLILSGIFLYFYKSLTEDNWILYLPCFSSYSVVMSVLAEY